MTGDGLVLPECRVAAAPGVVVVQLDIRVHRFLADHLVDGRPLLSTVLGAEVMACALAAVRPGVRVDAITGVRVGPPFFLPAAGIGDVEVEVDVDAHLPGGGSARCTVRSTDPATGARTEHFSGDVHAAAAPVAASPEASPALPQSRPVPHPSRRVNAADIYQLFFHGPSFRVLDWASFEGDTMLGRLASDLPPITAPARASLLAPLLIELCLQSAGLWELAALGTMTVPSGIDEVRRLTAADSPFAGTLTVLVTPRGAGVFDAVVLDAAGTPHLAVEGYRTTPFAHPYDRPAADRLRAALTAG